MSVLLKVEHIFYTPKDFVLFKKSNKQEPILKDISFELNKGEILGIVGESGSGKTTLIKVIAGVLKHDKGNVLFNKNLKSNSSSPIQILFQNTNELINPLRKVGNILNDSFRNNSKLEEICNLLDIPANQFKKFGYQLSGGERQRVGLARVLSADPELLILDEPFSAQDPESQEGFLNLFKKIKNELDITIICVTHDIKLIKKLADNVIVLFGGKIMESGSTERVFEFHRHPYTNFLNDAFNYKLYRNNFADDSASSISKTGCTYYSRCGNRSEKCLDTVDEFISDNIRTYCNFPI